MKWAGEKNIQKGCFMGEGTKCARGERGWGPKANGERDVHEETIDPPCICPSRNPPACPPPQAMLPTAPHRDVIGHCSD